MIYRNTESEKMWPHFEIGSARRHERTSVAVLVDISIRSPRKLNVYITRIKKILGRSVTKTFYLFSNKITGKHFYDEFHPSAYIQKPKIGTQGKNVMLKVHRMKL